MQPYAFVKWLALVCLCICASACQTARKKLDLPTLATLNLYTAHDVNPDADGRASPVVVRIFKLTDDRRFKRADFLSLYEGADGRLGDNLLAVVTLKELAPGEVRQEVIRLPDETRAIGIMAEFSQYQSAQPLLALSITPHANNTYEVGLSKAAVTRIER